MKTYIEERVLETADYIIQTAGTVRGAAKKFGISKSTVHKDITERLQDLDIQRYAEVQQVLQKNRNERHIRGGEATRLKYLSKL